MTELAERLEATAVAPDDAPSLLTLLNDMAPQFERALPRHIDVSRFTRMALTTVRQNPGLLQCSPQSVLGGFMQAAQLGLEISDVRGQAYLIPRKNRGEMEATFQLGYRGLIDMAWRSGITVDVREVYDGEHFAVALGTDPKISHDWTPNRTGNPTAYYAVAHFSDDRRPSFDVMTRHQVEEHRDQFSSSGRGPWSDHFDAMARKTVIRRLLNPLPLAAEYATAVSSDEQVLHMDLDATVPEVVTVEKGTDDE